MNSEYFFNKTYILDNTSEKAILHNAKAFLLDCVENDSECELCKYYVNIATEKLEQQKLIDELGKSYTDYVYKNGY